MAEGRLDQQTYSPAMYSVYEMRVWRRRIQPNKWAAVALDVISTTSWFFTNLHPTMDLNYNSQVAGASQSFC